jgi:hypothetical protein
MWPTSSPTFVLEEDGEESIDGLARTLTRLWVNALKLPLQLGPRATPYAVRARVPSMSVRDLAEHEERPERQCCQSGAHHRSSVGASGEGTIAAERSGLVTTVDEHELGVGGCLLERTHLISPVEWTIWVDRQSAPAARRGIETPGIDLTIPTRAGE